MPPFVVLMLQAWGLTAIMMVIVWFIAVKAKNAGWVDVGWTLGLAICAWFYVLNLTSLTHRNFFFEVLYF